MCILCDEGALEILTVPLDGLEPGRLAEAVRTAREAAGAAIVDRAESILRGETSPEVGPELYRELVVERALGAGVVSRSAAREWRDEPSPERGTTDPRVQAFVSSCAEILDDYRVLVADRLEVVARFVEAHDDPVRFTRLGADGEPWFEYRGQAYAALNRAEAVEIAERELATRLHSIEPGALIRYTTLPDTALETLDHVRSEPPAVADAVLAQMVDLRALADDRIRSAGFAPFFRTETDRLTEDLRFGEWIIIRTSTA